MHIILPADMFASAFDNVPSEFPPAAVWSRFRQHRELLRIRDVYNSRIFECVFSLAYVSPSADLIQFLRQVTIGAEEAFNPHAATL